MASFKGLVGSFDGIELTGPTEIEKPVAFFTKKFDAVLPGYCQKERRLITHPLQRQSGSLTDDIEVAEGSGDISLSGAGLGAYQPGFRQAADHYVIDSGRIGVVFGGTVPGLHRDGR